MYEARADPRGMDHDRPEWGPGDRPGPEAFAVTEPAPDRFLEACGSTTPLRLDLAGPGLAEAERRVFPRPFVVIGSAAETDLTLAHEDVSRRHAYLQLVAGRILCVDLQSRTGIRWEAGPEPWGWLGRQRTAHIGPFQLRDRSRPGEDRGGDGPDRPADDSRPLSSLSPGRSALPAVTLEFRDRAGEPREWSMEPILAVVGRSPACKVRLESPEVSKSHCSLVRTPTGVWVVDLLGRGGISVNGTSLRFARLEDGDQLRVGRFRIALRIAPPPNPSARALAVPERRGGRPGRRDGPETAALARVGPPAGEAGPVPATVIPPGTGTPRTLAGRGDQPDSLSATMLEEFGRIQLQMADQFQQALQMMFGMFSGMHQDQMGLIREELARIRELTEEQRALQAELARRPTLLEDRPTLRLVVGESPAASSTRSVDVGPATVARGAAREGEPGRPAPDLRPGLAMPAASAPDDAPKRPPPPGSQVPEDIHDELVRRLAAIQGESQGRWRKLLEAVMSAGSGRPLP